MNLKYLLIMIFLAGFASTLGQNKNTPPLTVQNVDLKKYVGMWYEIAKIPNRFQKNCTGGTTAEYSLRDDGRINVKNSCNSSDGEKDQTEGIAKIVENSNNAKLKVSFFSFLGIRPFWGDYWIIGLDKNYQYAVIGDPERKYGWILSRTKKLSQKNLDEAFKILKSQGYDPNRFTFTEQK